MRIFTSFYKAVACTIKTIFIMTSIPFPWLAEASRWVLHWSWGESDSPVERKLKRNETTNSAAVNIQRQEGECENILQWNIPTGKLQ